MDIEDYADTLNLELKVWYYPNKVPGWTASIMHAEIKEKASDSILHSLYGVGNTPLEALDGYINQIRGRILVINATDGKTRREYVVPERIQYMGV